MGKLILECCGRPEGECICSRCPECLGKGRLYSTKTVKGISLIAGTEECTRCGGTGEIKEK